MSTSDLLSYIASLDSNGIAAIITSCASIVVAIIVLIGVIINQGKSIKNTTNDAKEANELHHKENTRKINRLQINQRAMSLNQRTANKAIIRIEDKLGIEHTFVPTRKRS